MRAGNDLFSTQNHGILPILGGDMRQNGDDMDLEALFAPDHCRN
jgi:hypothetical protein